MRDGLEVMLRSPGRSYPVRGAGAGGLEVTELSYYLPASVSVGGPWLRAGGRCDPMVPISTDEPDHTAGGDHELERTQFLALSADRGASISSHEPEAFRPRTERTLRGCCFAYHFAIASRSTVTVASGSLSGGNAMSCVPIMLSRQNSGDHLAMHVGEPHVAAAEAVGQPLVIHAQEMQDRRVQVVDLDLVFDGVITVVVGGAVDRAALDSAAGHPHGEAIGVVVAAVGPLGHRGAAELAAPDDQGAIEQAAGLQVGEQAGDRLVDGAGVVLVAVSSGPDAGPSGRRRRRAKQLDEPHAPLDQSAGDQAFAGEDLRRRVRVVEAVEPLWSPRDSPLRLMSSGTADCMRKASS